MLQNVVIWEQPVSDVENNDVFMIDNLLLMSLFDNCMIYLQCNW